VRLIALMLAAALLLALLGLAQCRRSASAGAEARLAGGQAEAAIASGHDAAQTLGESLSNEAAVDRTGRENANAIDHATGADVMVPDGVRLAGMQSLCRRASYRAAHAECMQQPASR
jgi:hypothetical protein